MNPKNDPMGRAIADYHKHGKAGRLRVLSPVFEDDMPHSDYYGEQHNDAPDALPHSDYYGEQQFTMHYKDTRGEPFTWLYIDPVTLKQQTARHGYTAEIVATGTHYDYLARITKQEKQQYL